MTGHHKSRSPTTEIGEKITVFSKVILTQDSCGLAINKNVGTLRARSRVNNTL